MGLNKISRIIQDKVLIVSLCILICKRKTGENWLMLDVNIALDPQNCVPMAPRHPHPLCKLLHRPCSLAWTLLLQPSEVADATSLETSQDKVSNLSW